MTAPTIALVFTDLDNTLYDWVAWYSRAFHRMLDAASSRTKIPQDRLLREMQQLHCLRKRLEEPEALLHAPSIQQHFGSADEARVALRSAFDSYYHASYSMGLHTYPGVRSTLQRLAALGVAVIGHTEAPANHAVARLRALGLEHAFVSLLAAPASVNDPTLGEPDIGNPPFPIRTLLPEERKPNPDVLHQLCAHIDVPPQAALYVGDSLGRDVRMARAAGLWTAWARYGIHHDPRDWARVVEVSPWTAAQRANARREEPGEGSQPDAVLQESFAELLTHFDFAPRRPYVPSAALELVAT